MLETPPQPRRKDDQESRGKRARASHAAIEKVAQDGIAAIERGEFTVINGRDGSRALLHRLNERALARRGAGGAS